jgi:hypothetical protein
MGSADKSSGSVGADKGEPSGDQPGESGDDSQLDEVDEWGEESFPASDPPASWSGPPDT